MKKITFLIMCLVVMVSNNVFAQYKANDDIFKYNKDLSFNNTLGSMQGTQAGGVLGALLNIKTFINIGYVNQTLEPQYGGEIKSDYGFDLEYGKTIYFHRIPLLGRIKFGADLGIDLNYVKYKDYESKIVRNATTELWEDEVNLGVHQGEAGFLIGPRVTVNILPTLKISGFFRYVPSWSCLVLDDDVTNTYASFFTYGGEITWMFIGLGIEGRHGSAKYDSFVTNDAKIKYTTNAMRVYLTFRF